MKKGIYFVLLGIYCLPFVNAGIKAFFTKSVCHKPNSLNLISESTKFLEVERGGIKCEYDPEELKAFEKLESLDMRNSLITTLIAVNFEHAYNVRDVILSDNNITKIDGGVLEKASKLENLWMNNSNVRILDNDSFKGLKHLKLLSLENNEIAQLPKSIFNALINLEHLNLGKNKLEKLENGIFDYNTKLNHIDLRDNELKYIDEYVFKNIIKINFLNITNNSIENLVLTIKEITNLEAKNCGIRKLHISGMVKTIHVEDNRIEESFIGN